MRNPVESFSFGVAIKTLVSPLNPESRTLNPTHPEEASTRIQCDQLMGVG